MISVVLTTYNHENTVEQAVESVVSQKMEFELIVVDDKSTDNTVQKLEQLKDKYKFRLIVSPTNMGPSASRNKGIKSAKGEFIAFLDGDDYWLEDRLKATMVPLEKDKDLDVTYCDALLEVDGKLSTTLQSDLMPVARNDEVLAHLFRRNSVNMCAVTMRTALARKVMFDEKFRSGEDYDFWLRVAATDAKFHHIGKPLVVYRIHQGNLSGQRLLSIDSTLKVLEKNAYLAKADEVKKNLALQVQSLLEDRLKLDDADALETLSELKKNRNLGKRERIIKLATRINKHTGKALRKRLIK